MSPADKRRLVASTHMQAQPGSARPSGRSDPIRATIDSSRFWSNPAHAFSPLTPNSVDANGDLPQHRCHGGRRTQDCGRRAGSGIQCSTRGPRGPPKAGRSRASDELSFRRTTGGSIRRATARRCARLASHSSQVQSVLSFETEFTLHLILEFNWALTVAAGVSAPGDTGAASCRRRRGRRGAGRPWSGTRPGARSRRGRGRLSAAGA